MALKKKWAETGPQTTLEKAQVEQLTYTDILTAQKTEITSLTSKLKESTISFVQQPGVIGTKSNTGVIIFFAIIAMVLLLTGHKVAGIKI
jgi:hypothetical protein